ncbi:MAG: type II toxin-antitoxin system VapC family toxin [Acidimicrobiales bacterium]|nr:type II toxin-antitoxin system VapC family toxin [Acidimicrobiales bacterium]
MTAVVIDASAGAEIVAGTARGRALARLLPTDTVGWVPDHFYAEVLGVLRRRLVGERSITETEAASAVARPRDWHLRQAAVQPLIDQAWRHRHNMTAADALYVALAELLRVGLGHLTGAPQPSPTFGGDAAASPAPTSDPTSAGGSRMGW